MLKMQHMLAAQEAYAPYWLAKLQLSYAKIKDVTRPILRRHYGPLRVQKHFYAEGPEVCQHIIVHPPAGIAGGDHLVIDVNVKEEAWALLTSPGAAKWYRADCPASQKIHLTIADGATLEWLPQETIIFNQAQAQLEADIYLVGNARLCYWDIVALGRQASFDTFDQGYFQSKVSIRRDGYLIWYEQQRIVGNDRLLSSPIGLDGHSVFGTFLITGTLPQDILESCRDVHFPNVYGDLTQIPGLIVVRCLADQALTARNWFIAIWQRLRPALLGRQACIPRIWNT